jgi:hypothetical protein
MVVLGPPWGHPLEQTVVDFLAVGGMLLLFVLWLLLLLLWLLCVGVGVGVCVTGLKNEVSPVHLLNGCFGVALGQPLEIVFVVGVFVVGVVVVLSACFGAVSVQVVLAVSCSRPAQTHCMKNVRSHGKDTLVVWGGPGWKLKYACIKQNEKTP